VKIGAIPMESDIYKILKNKQQSILSRWVPAVLGHDNQNQQFTRTREKDRFSDPLGYEIAVGTEGILHWLLHNDPDMDVTKPLEAICRIKAVQDSRPSESLHFLFDLKTIIRECLKEERDINQYTEEIWEIDRRIDEMALLAFDLFNACRHQIYRLQTEEIKRMYGRG